MRISFQKLKHKHPDFIKVRISKHIVKMIWLADTRYISASKFRLFYGRITGYHCTSKFCTKFDTLSYCVAPFLLESLNELCSVLSFRSWFCSTHCLFFEKYLKIGIFWKFCLFFMKKILLSSKLGAVKVRREFLWIFKLFSKISINIKRLCKIGRWNWPRLNYLVGVLIKYWPLDIYTKDMCLELFVNRSKLDSIKKTEYESWLKFYSIKKLHMKVN